MVEEIKSKIRTIPNWPKQGIMFRDITTLLKDPVAFNKAVNIFIERYKDKPITKILGIESRGFIFGSVLASKLNLPFILARKPGKLPAATTKMEYELEYGTDALEIHNDAIEQGDNILIVDDLIATAGTLKATAELVEKLGGKVHECAVVIELPDLKGREKIKNYNTFSIVQFEGE